MGRGGGRGNRNSIKREGCEINVLHSSVHICKSKTDVPSISILDGLVAEAGGEEEVGGWGGGGGGRLQDKITASDRIYFQNRL